MKQTIDPDVIAILPSNLRPLVQKQQAIKVYTCGPWQDIPDFRLKFYKPEDRAWVYVELFRNWIYNEDGILSFGYYTNADESDPWVEITPDTFTVKDYVDCYNELARDVKDNEREYLLMVKENGLDPIRMFDIGYTFQSIERTIIWQSTQDNTLRFYTEWGAPINPESLPYNWLAGRFTLYQGRWCRTPNGSIEGRDRCIFTIPMGEGHVKTLLSQIATEALEAL